MRLPITGFDTVVARLSDELSLSRDDVVDVGPKAWRRGWDASIRLAHQPPNLGHVPRSFADWELVGPYLNVRLGRDVVNELARSALEDSLTECSGVYVAIEHTSLTPAYPINLATSRTSFVGDSLVRSYQMLGAAVSPHYFMDDKCWHAGIVGDRHQRWIHLKPDHAVGRAFAHQRFLRGKGADTRQALAQAVAMFPEIELRPYGEGERFGDPASACLSGILETLSRSGVDAMVVDRTSVVVTDHMRARLSQLAAGQASVPKWVLVPFDTPSYVVSSACYLASLAESHDVVISVVSHRQRVQVESAVYWSGLLSNSESRLGAVYVGEVIVDGASDGISLRRFHTTDEAAQQVGKALGTDQRGAFDAIRCSLLSANLLKTVNFAGGLAQSITSMLGRTLLAALTKRRLPVAPADAGPGTLAQLLAGVYCARDVVAHSEPRLALGALRMALRSETRGGARSGVMRDLAQLAVARTTEVLGVRTVGLG